MPADNKKSEKPLLEIPVSMMVERVWMTQQQQPDRCMWHVAAFVFPACPDIWRLEQAIERLVEYFPGISAYYAFDEEEGLGGFQGAHPRDLIGVFGASSIEDVSKIVKREQKRLFDAERNPPFRLLIFVLKTEYIIVVLTHDLLAMECDISRLIRDLLLLYGGCRALECREDVTMLDIAGYGASFSDAIPRPIAPVQFLGHMGEAGPVAGLVNDASNRCRIGFDRALLGTGDGVSSEYVFARLASLFSLFMVEFWGWQQADLLWVDAEMEYLAGWSFPVPFSDVKLRKVFRDDSLTELQHRIFSNFSDKPENEDRLCSIGAREVAAPSIVFRKMNLERNSHVSGKLEAKEIVLPSSYFFDGLIVCMGQNRKCGLVTLDLVCGEYASPYGLASLLESFIKWCKLHKETEYRTLLNNDEHFGGKWENVQKDRQREITESRILEEFRDALAAPELSTYDDFFDFGGHSLSATRVIGRLQDKYGIEIEFNDLFGNPTAHALACVAKIRDRAEGDSMASRGFSEGRHFPLSMAQQSLWKVYAAFEYGPIFNIPFSLDFLQEIDERAFFKAFEDIIARHSVLRSLFIDMDGQVVQYVLPENELSAFKWCWLSDEGRDATRGSEASWVFDLSRELPLRLRFFRNEETGRQELSMLFHHVVIDEWSVNILMDELAVAYKAHANGRSPVFSRTPLPFCQFAKKQADAGVDAASLGYWLDLLRPVPTPEPFVIPQKRSFSENRALGEKGGWVEFVLDEETSAGIYRLARFCEASLFNVAYVGVVSSLWRVSGLTEFIVGTSAAARSDSDYFDTIGYFTTVVAHKVRLDPAQKICDLVQKVKATVNESMPRSHIPIDVVEGALGMSAGKDHAFEVFIQIHAKNRMNGVLEGRSGERIEYRQIDPDKHESMLGLQFEIMDETVDEHSYIRVLMSYRSSHYDEEDVALLRETVNEAFLRLGSGDGANYRIKDVFE